MGYTALYRKFRPSTFDEVKGQDPIVTTLKNQLRTGRIGHAYLFCGTRGTGKTSVAKILARAVNCEQPTESGPCNQCATCRSILEGSATGVIEIDAASNNGVDNVREIREEVAYRPTSGKYKVYIIDEVHMLSPGAFNALLKTLEEPPDYVIFILATTEAAKIPVTILSRCQRYDFHRIRTDEIAARCADLLAQEGIRAEEKALHYIARLADGSMRDALSLLEQCVSFQMNQELTYDLVLEVLGTADNEVFSGILRCILAGDAGGCIRQLEELVQQGKEMGQFVADLSWYLRNLLLVKASDQLEDLVDISSDGLSKLYEEASMVEAETLMRYIRVLSELSGVLRQAAQKRTLVETTLIRLCRPEMENDRESLLDRIRVLEKKIEEGARFAVPPAPVPPVAQQVAGEETEIAEPPAAIKAAPEDLRRIKEQWRAIVREVSAGPRYFLEMAEIKYDGDSGENILFVEMPNAFQKKMLDREDVIGELKGIIRARTGREVELHVTAKGAEGRRLEEIPLEQIVAGAVDMEVEEYVEEYDAGSLRDEPSDESDPDTEYGFEERDEEV